MTSWLSRDAVILDVVAPDLATAVNQAIPPLARITGVDVAVLQAALVDAARESGFAIGAGVAVPHASLDGLDSPVVAFVRLAQPIDVGAMDRAPADLVFASLFPAGDPRGHLAFLAHLAHLLQSRLFRDGLRSADSADDVIALIEAAESRTAASPRAATQSAAAETYLAVISLAGEKAVDAVLVELLDCGLADATIVEAQSVREAASREVPLFAGFQDIFGDPGGRRVIMSLVSADQVDDVANMVRRVCEDRNAASGEVLFVPVASRWKWVREEEAPPAGGH